MFTALGAYKGDRRNRQPVRDIENELMTRVAAAFVFGFGVKVWGQTVPHVLVYTPCGL